MNQTKILGHNDISPIAILLTDTHLSEENISANESIFKQAIDYAIKYNVDLIHLGDVFTSRKAQPLCVLLCFNKILQRIRDSGKKITIIPGNHDKADYTSWESYLHTYEGFDNLTVIHDGGITKLNNALLCYLPFFTDPIYLSKIEQLNSNVQALYSDVEYKILLTHVAINGVVNNDGTKVSNKLGRDVFSTYTKVVSGHYHNAQTFDNIYYIGSTLQHNFGEDDNKGLFLLSSDGDLTQLPTEFPRYKKVTISAQQITQLQFDNIIQSASVEKNEGVNVQIVLVGEESQVKSLDTSKAEQLGVKVKQKHSFFNEQLNRDNVHEMILDGSKIIQHFETYCKQKSLNTEEGLQFLNKLIQ